MKVLGYAELSERWGIQSSTLMVWKHRGKLPEPDIHLGQAPGWYEKTIKKLEDTNGITRKGSR